MLAPRPRLVPHGDDAEDERSQAPQVAARQSTDAQCMVVSTPSAFCSGMMVFVTVVAAVIFVMNVGDRHTESFRSSQ